MSSRVLLKRLNLMSRDAPQLLKVSKPPVTSASPTEPGSDLQGQRYNVIHVTGLDDSLCLPILCQRFITLLFSRLHPCCSCVALQAVWATVASRCGRRRRQL